MSNKKPPWTETQTTTRRPLREGGSFMVMMLLFVLAPAGLLSVVTVGALYLVMKAKRQELDGFQWFMTSFVVLAVWAGVVWSIFGAL